MSEGKLNCGHLLRLNGLLSKHATLRQAVPAATRSAWLHMKRRPTWRRVKALLRACGVPLRKLQAAPSREGCHAPARTLRVAWDLSQRLERITTKRCDLVGTSDPSGSWIVQCGEHRVLVGDVLTLIKGRSTLFHTEAVGVIEARIKSDIHHMRRRTTKTATCIKSLHDRSRQLHMHA